MNSIASERKRQQYKEQAAERQIERIRMLDNDKRLKYGYKQDVIRNRQRDELIRLEHEYANLKTYLSDYAMELYSRINNLRCRL